MSLQRVLADTGPLVAMLSRADEHHLACAALARQIKPPLLTSWPVITEAAWLLRARRTAVDRLLELVQEGAVAILELDRGSAAGLRRILQRYRSLRPQLADATLVYLAERQAIDTIFTLDRRDFSVYRTTRGRSFRLVPDIQSAQL